ncbi:MAG: methionyl-tRNA formyltransferase [Candidatus Eremiobacteraeota bacterium]|nr:methionyl-tRNA formyltransferase [Candidatus Eremiobacteraeota bacterium]
MRRLRTVFFGSSAFAVPSLTAAAREHDVVAVYTQADKPAGRGLRLTPTPVKVAAQTAGLPVFTPEKLDPQFSASVAARKPDVLIAASYGKILPRDLLSVPALAALNIHPSLLPAYRGATPIQAALRDGLTTTGLTIIWMSPQMDAGDIALAERVSIAPDDDFQTLHDRLAQIGAELLVRALSELARGSLARVPQDPSAATYTRPITKEETRLRLDDAPSAANLVRALSPRPAAWLELGGRRIKVLRARAEDVKQPTGAPGSVLSLEGDGPLIACAAGALRLLRVVPEGKPPMSGAEFARSLR